MVELEQLGLSPRRGGCGTLEEKVAVFCHLSLDAFLRVSR